MTSSHSGAILGSDADGCIELVAFDIDLTERGTLVLRLGTAPVASVGTGISGLGAMASGAAAVDL